MSYFLKVGRKVGFFSCCGAVKNFLFKLYSIIGEVVVKTLMCVCFALCNRECCTDLQHNFMKFTSCISWTQLVFLLWFIKLAVFGSLFSAGSPCLPLRAHWPHGRMTASLHYVCAKHRGLHDVKYQNTPPLYQAGWIILMKHQIIAFGNCSTRRFSASCAVIGFSPSPVTVLQTISRLAVEVCPHTGVCWPLSGHTKGSRLLHARG